MKNYIIKNLEPILLGIVIGLVFMVVKDTTDSIIAKIAIINQKEIK